MNERQRILTVWPHPDDETFAAGGTIAKYAQNNEVVTAFTTDGTKGWNVTREYHEGATLGDQDLFYRKASSSDEIQEFKEQREQEAIEAGRRLGIPGTNIIFLRLPDQGMDETRIDELEKLVRDVDPHVIISYGEDGFTGHPDHTFTSLCIQRAKDILVQEWVKMNGSRREMLPNFSLRRVARLVCPEAASLDKWSTLSLPQEELTYINVEPFVNQVLNAAFAHNSQLHLVQIFRDRGITGRTENIFFDGGALVTSSAGTGDLLYALDEVPTVPNGFQIEQPSRYCSNIPNFYTTLVQRYQRVFDDHLQTQRFGTIFQRS